MPADGQPDQSAYIVLIHRFFLNERLKEPAKYYKEMKAKGLSPRLKQHTG